MTKLKMTKLPLVKVVGINVIEPFSVFRVRLRPVKNIFIATFCTLFYRINDTN